MDPIADMFTRIRNASAVRKDKITLPMSKLKKEIALILEREGWVKGTKVVPGGLEGAHNKFDELEISLKYRKNGKPQISSIKRISRPGLKLYVSKDEVPKVLNGFGMAIISTSQGLMTDKEARLKKVGGEILGEIF